MAHVAASVPEKTMINTAIEGVEERGFPDMFLTVVGRIKQVSMCGRKVLCDKIYKCS